MQRRPSLRAQHASISRRHLYAPRASVVPRRTCSACAPGTTGPWPACPGTRTRASIEISRARRRRSPPRAPTGTVSRQGEARGRVVGTVHRFDCRVWQNATSRGPAAMLPPGVPPQAFFGMPPSTIPSQSQSGINYTIAYDDSGASTRLRHARLSFLKTDACASVAPSPRRSGHPHAHPPSPNSIPRHPHGDHRRRCGRCPRRPRCHLRPSRGRPRGRARPHPNLPDDHSRPRSGRRGPPPLPARHRVGTRTPPRRGPRQCRRCDARRRTRRRLRHGHRHRDRRAARSCPSRRRRSRRRRRRRRRGQNRARRRLPRETTTRPRGCGRHRVRSVRGRVGARAIRRGSESALLRTRHRRGVG